MKPADATIDCDDYYHEESGQATKKPHEMIERTYHAVRFMLKATDSSRILTKSDTTLKKNDVVKLGRIKLKVKSIFS